MFEDNDPPVYCPNCGSIVDAGAAFCDVCGARIPPNAAAAGPTREIPTVVPPPQAPQQQTAAHGNRNLVLFLGIGAVLLVLLAVGAVFAVNLSGNDSASGGRGSGPVGGSKEGDGGASKASNESGKPEQGSQAGGSDSESKPSTPEPETSTPEPATSGPGQSSVPTEAEVISAVEEYYRAVDAEDWGYTYNHLDSQTQALYTEDEWYAKNQYYADVEGVDLVSMNVAVNGSVTDPVVSVTVDRSFTDGTSITRTTLFLLEDGTWKHRFTEEENAIYMPGVPYEEFVASQ